MISLENLADGSVSDRNFQKLMSLVLDTGGQSVAVRFGTNTVVFSAAAASAGRTVTHGLGKTPLAVLATNQQTGVTMTTATYGATTFVATGYFAATATGTFTFSWVAIG